MNDKDSGTITKLKNSLSPAGWIALASLTGFLVAAFCYSAHVWLALGGVHISGFGWFSLVLGVVVTLGLGGGLMGLVFYSSRHDMDR